MPRLDDESGRSIVATLNHAYNRFFGCIGNILMGHPSAIQVRPSFPEAMMGLSLLVALASALSPAIFGLTDRSLKYFSFPLSAMWTLLVVFAVLRCGKRGLLTLVGLPFAMFWPVLTALFTALCDWGYDCL